MNLVLASTSQYRRELLEGISEFDDGLMDKFIHDQAIVIGCDQVAVAEGRILGKPGNRENAVRQLRALSGRDAFFHTALCVLDSTSSRTSNRIVSVRVRFRALDDPTIERYLEREQPYDCAGSAKSEGLGIALIAAIEGEDPNALVGLPLIALVDLLAEHGVRVP